MAATFPKQIPLRDRPELGGAYSRIFHNYAQEEPNAQLKHAISVVNHCMDGLRLEYSLEEHLVENEIVSPENPGLIGLEHAVLDISTLEYVQGVSYHVLMRYKGHYILRFMESGCYEGLMRNTGKPYLATKHLKGRDDLLLFEVYNRRDIEKRLAQKAVSSVHNSQMRRKGQAEESHQQVQRSRPDVQYMSYLKQNKMSLINQLALFEESYSNKETREFEIISGVVHVLRKNATPKNKLHRYVYMIKPKPEQIATWDNFFTQHIVDGLTSDDCTDVSSAIASARFPLSLLQQFDLMSALPNNHWDSYPRFDGRMSTSSCVGYMQHFSYQKTISAMDSDHILEDLPSPTHLPRSYRNRILYFVQHGDRRNLNLIMRCLLSCDQSESCPTDHDYISEPVPKRPRRYTPRIVKLTPEMLPEVSRHSFKPPRSLYSDFKESLITDGTVLWRLRNEDSSVFLLNDYSLQSGYMSGSSYVHLTISRIEDSFQTHCTCEAYAYLQSCAIGMNPIDHDHEEEDILIDSSMSCMHVRFFVDALKSYLHLDNIKELPNRTLLDKKIKGSLTSLNCGVVPLGQMTESQLAMFSVRGRQEDTCCSFVTISKDGCYINCKSGTCQAKFLNRKRIPRIMEIQTAAICDHLETMRSNSHIWNFLVKEQEGDASSFQGTEDHPETVNLNVEDELPECFDVETGLWNFGGLSSHIPMPETDLKLSRCARKRWLLSEDRRNKDGYLLGSPLLPEKPDSCDCGAGYDEEASLKEDYCTKLFTQNAPVHCQVFKRICRNSHCQIVYSGEDDCIHQWSKDICAGDELGWSFVREVKSKKTSFSAFCEGKTADYRMLNVLSAPFMSKTTFLKWFFLLGSCYENRFQEGQC